MAKQRRGSLTRSLAKCARNSAKSAAGRRTISRPAPPSGAAQAPSSGNCDLLSRPASVLGRGEPFHLAQVALSKIERAIDPDLGHLPQLLVGQRRNATPHAKDRVLRVMTAAT